MSFDINWDKLAGDEKISSNIKQFLQSQFDSISLPSFINELQVTDFSLGHIPPNIVIRHIGNPFDEFYQDADNSDEERRDPPIPEESNYDSSSSDEEAEQTILPDLEQVQPADDDENSKSKENLRPFPNYNMNNLGLGPHERETPTTFFKPNTYRAPSRVVSGRSDKKSDDDIQFVVEVDYHGEVLLEVTVNLNINYPSTSFISLPIKLKITDLEIHCLAVIAYLKNSVFLSFLCDLDDAAADYFTSQNPASQTENSNGEPRSSASHASMLGGNFVDYGSSNNRDRIDVIRNVKIETEIGEVEHNVLRNVGKIEKFLVEELRSLIRDEVCWPSWLNLDLSDEET